MSQEQAIQFVEQAAGEGRAAPDVARTLGAQFSGLSLADGAAAIRRLPPQVPGASAGGATLADAAAAPGGDPTNAAYDAWLLRHFAPNAPPTEIGAQVRIENPQLTAVQMAEVLIHGEPTPVFPTLTAADMVVALVNPQVAGAGLVDVAEALHAVYPALAAVEVGRVLMGSATFGGITAPTLSQALTAAPFPSSDVTTAVAALFPATATTLPPVGGPGSAFDDGPAALEIGQPLTRIRVCSGDIVDNIQSFYGAQATPLPPHGGSGGQPTDVVVDPRDPITAVSGAWGVWYGGTYVLSLTFTTRSGKRIGPFGTQANAMTSSPFSFTVPDGAMLLGFAGTVGVGNNGAWYFLGSLGLVVQGVQP